MLTVEAALGRILSHVPALQTERVLLADAYGRVLAEAVDAPLDLPPWANSAMDGFAVRSSDLPGTLQVLETVAAGSVARQAVRPGTAIRIMTGAPVPEGADAVVMVEDTTVQGDGVSVGVSARAGQHVRPQGSDVRVGQRVLEAGRRLGPGAVGLLGSFGLTEVTVARRPRVAIVTTGDEVVPPGQALGGGQIYGSNALALAGLVLEAGGVPVDLGNCPDDPALLRERFIAAAAAADLVVSTGGVSVGDFDHVKEALGQVDFWRVAMKPGKPLAFGELGGRPFFGLPGNPVSCMVNFLQFVRPFVRTMMGDPRPFLPVIAAELRRPLRRAPGRVELLRVRLEHEDGRVYAVPAGGHQGSGNVLGMADGHGFALLDATSTELSGTVQVQVFDAGWADGAQPDYPWGDAPAPSSPRCC